MTAAWIIEAVDVFEDGDLGLPSGVPCVPPDQFGFDAFEEGLDGGVIPLFYEFLGGAQTCLRNQHSMSRGGRGNLDQSLRWIARRKKLSKMKKRKNHSPEFMAKVALEAIREERGG